MPQAEPVAIDRTTPPFDRFRNIQWLGSDRRGRRPSAHVRHHLYVGYDTQSRANLLIKVTAKPGLVYQQNLANEIQSLTTINRELPDSRYFPFVLDHGSLRDGRTFAVTSLFDEFPLATTIGDERMPARLVVHLRTTIEVARALAELHGLEIFHVDLNPMNILFRWERGAPVVRVVDFESSYERSRHGAGAFYDPPVTPGYSAPEVPGRAPDACADVYSLGAVLYTLLAGFQWTWASDAATSVGGDRELDAELREMLLRAVDPDPQRRFRSAQQFSDALGGYLERIWPGRRW